MTIITEIEAVDAQLAGLHQRTPYAIQNVSNGQFSIARHSGGCTFNGDHYTYFEGSDELVRNDVLKYVKNAARLRPKIEAELQKVSQGELL